MAEIIRNKGGFIDCIRATTVKGNNVTIHGAGSAGLMNSFLAAFVFGGDARPQLSIRSAFNIKGARDGANTLLTVKSNSERGDLWEFRVRETPEELRSLFKEAALEDRFPAVQEKFVSKVCLKLFGKPFYTPVTPG
ncbi:MAG: hypothetical protein ACAH83_09865 [Alphaproteobacteria bacterium]